MMRIEVTILTIYYCFYHKVKIMRTMKDYRFHCVAIAKEAEKYIVICGFRPKTQHESTIKCWPW